MYHEVSVLHPIFQTIFPYLSSNLNSILNVNLNALINYIQQEHAQWEKYVKLMQFKTHQWLHHTKLGKYFIIHGSTIRQGSFRTPTAKARKWDSYISFVINGINQGIEEMNATTKTSETNHHNIGLHLKFRHTLLKITKVLTKWKIKL